MKYPLRQKKTLKLVLMIFEGFTKVLLSCFHFEFLIPIIFSKFNFDITKTDDLLILLLLSLIFRRSDPAYGEQIADWEMDLTRKTKKMER